MSRNRRILVGPIELSPDVPVKRTKPPFPGYYCENGFPQVRAEIVRGENNSGDLVIHVYNQRWKFPIWCKSGIVDALNILGTILTVRPDLPADGIRRIYSRLMSELNVRERRDLEVHVVTEDTPDPSPARAPSRRRNDDFFF